MISTNYLLDLTVEPVKAPYEANEVRNTQYRNSTKIVKTPIPVRTPYFASVQSISKEINTLLVPAASKEVA